MVNKQVNGFWARQLRQSAKFSHPIGILLLVKKHPLIQNVRGQRDIPRVRTRLKLMTGTYILQSNRVAFNQAPVDPTCMLCEQDPETTEHFLVSCGALAVVRKPTLETLLGYANSSSHLLVFGRTWYS